MTRGRWRARRGIESRAKQPLLRRLLLATLSLLPVFAGCEQEIVLFADADRGAVDPSTAVNLVLVTMDSTRADALGSYGQVLQPTPYLDALAADGVVFTQVESASPDSLPAHATLLTGKLPFSHGVRPGARSALSDEHETLAEILDAAGYVTGAEIAGDALSRGRGLARGFREFRDVDSPDADWHRVSVPDGDGARELTLPERGASQISEWGIDFLARHREVPFFLWLHYYDPHMIYAPPPRYLERMVQSPYHAEILHMDAQIQRVIEAIERFGLRGRTLVVITADHGEGLYEHGEETHGFFLYESTTRVPLIFWGPDFLPRGLRIDAVARSADVAPSVLDWLGLPPLAEADGLSLRPLVSDTATAPARLAYGESFGPQRFFGGSPIRFVRQGRWKYIHKPAPELYDLEADPDETRNEIQRRPEEARVLRAELAALLADGTAGLETFAPGAVDPTDQRDDLERLEKAASAALFQDYEAAAAGYAELLARYPGSADLHVRLIQALGETGRWEPMLPVLWSLLELEPDNERAQLELIRLLARQGDRDGMVRVARLALEGNPCSWPARSSLAEDARRQGEYAEQMRLLSEGIEQCPPHREGLNNYAYALATSPVDDLRDGLQAVEIARRIAEVDPPHPAYLDTLAVAYAEVGLFETAIQQIEVAIELMERAGAPEAAATPLREHLELFRQGLPVRER